MVQSDRCMVASVRFTCLWLCGMESRKLSQSGWQAPSSPNLTQGLLFLWLTCQQVQTELVFKHGEDALGGSRVTYFWRLPSSVSLWSFEADPVSFELILGLPCGSQLLNQVGL